MNECRVCGDGSIVTQKICRQCLMMLQPSCISQQVEKKQDNGFDPFAMCDLCKNQDSGWDIHAKKFRCKDSCSNNTK